MSARRLPLWVRVPPRFVGRAVELVAGALDSLRRAITPAPAAMMQTIVEDFVVGRCLGVAVKMGIADSLESGAKTVEALALEAGADADTLHRVLRLLASRGIFSELPEGRFGPTRFSRCLVEGAPESLYEWACYNETPSVWPSWTSLPETMRNGRSLCENAHDLRFFEWLARDPDLAGRFDLAMTRFSRALAPTIVAAYDFSRFESIVDVAGGQGVLLAEILREHPKMRGTVFERQVVVDVARLDGPCAEAGISERCAFEAGDMFEWLPPDHDAYLLKWVLHDWRDDECQRVLAACRRAMGDAKHRRLIIVEMVVEEQRATPTKLAMDVVMLSLSGGRERSERQYRGMLAAAGFELTRVTHTLSPLSVIEARPR